MDETSTIYAIDIGDAYIRGGVFIQGITHLITKLPTPKQGKNQRDDNALWFAVAQVIETISKDAPPVDGLAVSASGIMTLQPKPGVRDYGRFRDYELFVSAPNVDGLKYVPIISCLEQLELNVPIHVENDVNAALISVTELADAILVNIGDGLGAAVKRDGVIQHVDGNWSCYEIGHGMRWDLPEHLTRRCQCGNLGCLEAVIGGWAMAERYGVRPEHAQPAAYDQMRDDVINLLPPAIAAVMYQTGVSNVVLSGTGSHGYGKESDFVGRLREQTQATDNDLRDIEMKLINVADTAELHGVALALLHHIASTRSVNPG